MAYDGPRLYGDFSMFRAPTVTIYAQLDQELLTEISRAAEQANLITLRITPGNLDHGTAVPLYFLQRNGWNGKVVALGYSFLSNEDHVRFGNCIRAAIDKLRRPVAFIASGDLSHRLKRDAPAGYNPDAHLFDEEVVDAIRLNSTSRIIGIDQSLRRLAGECGYRSMLVGLGVAEGLAGSCEVISYEAPFGVGYLVAQLFTAGAGVLTTESSRVGSQSLPRTSTLELCELPALARRAVETFVTAREVIDSPTDLPDVFNARGACFVCIKTVAGDLRGCIGTIDPEQNTLAEELIANAISAATRDPRFPTVKKDELPQLKYSIDVLSAAEPCTLDDLDPEIYGVIVKDESSSRRGLLLPNLEGIRTSAQQLEIAKRKAGIKPGTPVKIFRFQADRYSE